MNRLQKILITGVLAVEALVFLVPATLLYLGALLLTANVALGGNHEGVDATFLVMVPLLLLPGYGLFSLWWLVMRHQEVCWREVPRRIRGGLVVGIVIAVAAIFAIMAQRTYPSRPFLPQEASYVMMLLTAMGPLLVAFTAVLAITRPWRGKERVLGVPVADIPGAQVPDAHAASAAGMDDYSEEPPAPAGA